MDLNLPTAPILGDESLDDADSSYGGEGNAASETSSLYSVTLKNLYENGRRYHNYRAGAYWGPNDEPAQNNLDILNHIFALTLDGNLFLAPISPNPQRVLDLGTGTGIWALDFADKFPSAFVVAIDLTPIQPPLVPPNLQFQIDDFCQPWTFSKSSFDFIHARSIYGCVADYDAFYGEIMEHLKPGGWFEQVEISVVPKSEDGSLAGALLEEWGTLVIGCGEMSGKSFTVAEDSRAFMEKAGFVNVERKTFKWPIGPWPQDLKMKEIGAYNQLAWDEGIHGWASSLFTKYLALQPEEIQVLCDQIKRDVRNKEIHAYQDISVCYCQRPG